MTYRETLTRLGDTTAAQVAAIIAAWEAGDLTDEEAVDLIAAYVEAANNRAVSLADVALAASLTVATGKAVTALGLTPATGDRDRLTTAATTLLGVLKTTPDPIGRARRLGRSEPLTTAARARGDAIERQPSATGWTRSVSGSGCQLCEWWSRDGRVWPDTHPMPTHKGCTCTQEPTIREHIKPVANRKGAP